MRSVHDTTAWQARVRQLEDCFSEIERTRMAGLPMLHPGLRVCALGFEPDAATPAGQVPVLTGVLITPWFMNLMRLPRQWPVPADDASSTAASVPALAGVGVSVARRVGQAEFGFLGGFESQLGAYEACSLFSPMGEFADQAAARATAQEVLRQLRAEPAGPAHAPPASPARRGFLFGRRSGAAGAPGP